MRGAYLQREKPADAAEALRRLAAQAAEQTKRARFGREKPEKRF